MEQFFAENKLFVMNALLVTALVAAGWSLQTAGTNDSVAPTAASSTEASAATTPRSDPVAGLPAAPAKTAPAGNDSAPSLVPAAPAALETPTTTSPAPSIQRRLFDDEEESDD